MLSSVWFVYKTNIFIYTNSDRGWLSGGSAMNLETIGKNIRKYRNQRKLRQDQLAEKTDLSTNYIGMVERGEKIPALETFLKIANALEVSADMLLADVLYTTYAVKDSLLADKLDKLSSEDRTKIYDVIDTMIKHSSN